MLNEIKRSRTDKILGGVCGGLGKNTEVPTWVYRVLLAISVLYGFGVVLYILLWIFIPLEPVEASEGD